MNFIYNLHKTNIKLTNKIKLVIHYKYILKDNELYNGVQ